ncbi:WxL protein peptidoglycan domain-containing protein [Dactylosporangium sp. NPDC051541]|uniref:WxL protein peptidoglycan domain-containing protein n=1 Tax=Dactylosporangium sp. NPDC051541 TaxID=3363977 RepID=UPI0037B370FA
MRTLRAVAGLLIGLAILVPVRPAAAEPTPGSITWAVQPSSANGPDNRKEFSYLGIAPGSVIHDYVAVTNFSAMPVTFQLYSTDAQNGNNGVLQLQPAAEKPQDIGSWVTLQKTTVTLKPNERAIEPFTLTVPATATPGDHTGGVLASIGVEENSATGPVKVDRRLGVPMYLRVTGPLTAGIAVQSVSASYHGTANPLRGGRTDVTLIVRNTGNVRLNLTPEIAVNGLYWVKVAGVNPGALPNLLPGATVQFTVHLDGVFPLGPMTAKVRVTPAQITALGLPPAPNTPLAAEGEAFLWATPWTVLLILALLAGGYLLVRWVRRARRGRQQRVVADAVAKARKETVEELKKKALAGSGSAE